MQKTNPRNRPNRQSRSKRRPAAGNGAEGGAKGGGRLDRYLALAREAEASGDIVASHTYYQQAEHYVRQMRDRRERDAEVAQGNPPDQESE